MLLAGCVQLTAWKVRQGGRCWEADARSAWGQGIRLGVRCSLCCSGYMIVLLVTGMMNLAVMALIATSITVERLAPAPRRAAQAAGVVVIVTGAVLLARGLGA